MGLTLTEAQGTLSWGDAIEQFELHQAEAEKAALTIKTYREDLSNFHAWYVATFEGEPEIAAMTAAELREWKVYLRETRHLAAASANRHLSAIRSFLRWAEAEGHAPAIRTPKSCRKERQPPRWLSRKDQLAFVRAAERSEKRDRAIALTLLHTGARVSELAFGSWRDVKISPRKGSVVLHGKGKKDREVPLNAEARAALVDLGYPGRPNDRIVQGQRGPMGTEGIQLVVAEIARQAKLDHCTSHVLRHTFCRRLAEAGTRLEQIAALAGHESLDTTRLYVEPGKEELAAAVERLAGGDE